MDKPAIQEISNNAIAAALVATKAINQSEFAHNPVVALPKDFVLHDLESYLPMRTRLRGTFKTASIPEFAKYCPENTAFPVFVNSATLEAEAIFNYGDAQNPGHCDHSAHLTLQKTAPFSALLAITNTKTDQRTLAEWMEDWRDHITCHKDGQEGQDGATIGLSTAIASVRKITVAAQSETQNTVGSFSQEKSDFEKIEAKGDSLPSFIHFTCEPYQSLPQRTFVLRVAVNITGNDVGFALRIIKHEQHVLDMADDLAKQIKSAIGGKKSTIHIGSFEV